MKADGVRKEEEVREAAEIAAEKIRAGTYYKDALAWYHDVYHSPITDRSPIVLMLCVMGAVSFLAVVSLFSIFPLAPVTPLVVGSGDVDGFPKLKPLLESNMENPNPPIKKWYLGSFVQAWENYDIDSLDSLRRRVRFLSSPEVFEKYRRFYLGNDSPALKYERHTLREIKIRKVELTDDNKAEVIFEATEQGPEEDKKSVWRADITFAYEEIKVDQITNDITPMTFRVADYKVEKIG